MTGPIHKLPAALTPLGVAVLLAVVAVLALYVWLSPRCKPRR